MSITIGTLTLRQLQRQPFGYEQAAVLRGQTARRWDVQALATPAQWVDLVGIHDDWQEARILDPDPLVSNSVGTTVAFSCSANGLSWMNVPVWFIEAPQGEQVGAYVRVSFAVVAAADQLAVLLAQKAAEQAESDAAEPDYGQLEVGGVTLNLLADPNGYEDGPSVSLTATGNDLIEGPLTARRVRNVKGWTTNAGDWETLSTWYEEQVAAEPATGDWFPVGPPAPSRELRVVDGSPVTRYIVDLKLRQIG